MSLRAFLEDCARRGEVLEVGELLSTRYEIASVIKALDGGPLLVFKRVEGHPSFKVVSNICNRSRLMRALDAEHVEEAYRKLIEASERPSEPKVSSSGLAAEGHVMEKPDLGKLPVLLHYEGDAGPYITSAVISARSPDGNIENVSVHRLLVVGRDKLVIRLVPRHLYKLWRMAADEDRDLGVAISIGVHPAVMLASTTPVPFGVSEFHVANTLLGGRLKLFECSETGARAPAEAEVVIEGFIKARELAPEGPLVDITGTHDAIRQQPVVEVRRIMWREGAYYHAILPAGVEHKLLMGFPREAEIWRAVSKVVPRVVAVNLSVGGCGWLHAIIAVEKNVDGDAKNAIMAAFSAHPSLKHVVVVDPDIDIYNPADVEWAIATRFQASEDLIIVPNARGSSLDPSADQETGLTTKVGIDATIPLGRDKRAFERAKVPLTARAEAVIRRLLGRG